MIQLIPSIDLLNGRIVRLLHGDFEQVTYYDLEPTTWVERLLDAGAKRIHLVDLDGAFGLARQGTFRLFPKLFPEAVFQLGGGLRSRTAIDEVLGLGFEAVVGTLAVERPRELAGLSKARVICALDLRGDRIATKGWQAETSCESTDVFEALLSLGFDRALVTDVSRDGAMTGPGLEATRWVASEGFKVQASGGVRGMEDLAPLSEIPGVVGAITGKALLEGRLDLEDAAVRAALGGR